MKKIISLSLSILMVLSVIMSLSFTGSGVYDPTANYTPRVAEYEDSSLQMWFEHSNVKVFQDDHTDTGFDTYAIYMAKNEIQGMQVVLYSANQTKTNLTASISDFTNENGDTLDTELYYEFYILTEGLFTEDVYGFEEGEETIIRNGMTPDAIAPISSINRKTGKFSLAAGKSQTLYIRVKSALDTPSGWYSADFNVFNSNGQVIKCATVYTYVWNFQIPEEISFQTAVYINYTGDDETYKMYYDYLLENRLLGMQVPGEINSENEYISNPRVNAFRIASRNGYIGALDSNQIKAIYSDLSSMDNWEEIKKKAYFYAVDEPLSLEVSAGTRASVDTVKESYASLSKSWPDPNTVVTHCENHPYPYNTYSPTLALNANGTYAVQDDGRAAFANIKDATQEMMDTNTVKTWCPLMPAFTPRAELEAAGYPSATGVCTSTNVRNLDGQISGFNIFSEKGRYFDWDTKYGTFAERFSAYKAKRQSEGSDVNLWWYAAGNNYNYTYANHLIENTGLQSQIMFWQAMQVGSTGYLYYSANGWDEHPDNPIVGTDKDCDGSTSQIWQVNMYNRQGHDIFGNGVLFYGSTMRSTLMLGGIQMLGTVRVEHIRDGIEDYEMLNIYRSIYGEKKMQEVISKVSKNVACYLSLPLFDRSAYSTSLRDEDIFANVRIELGNAIEEGSVCTEHSWDEGVETIAPTLKTDGEMTYTCTVCGETYTEVIPLTAEPGDANGDGRFKANDLLILKKYIADDPITIQYIESRLDVNQDKRINIIDVRLLKRLISGE